MGPGIGGSRGGRVAVAWVERSRLRSAPWSRAPDGPSGSPPQHGFARPLRVIDGGQAPARPATARTSGSITRIHSRSLLEWPSVPILWTWLVARAAPRNGSGARRAQGSASAGPCETSATSDVAASRIPRSCSASVKFRNTSVLTPWATTDSSLKGMTGSRKRWIHFA